MRLLVIDPNVIMESPTMRSWITSLERFAPLFTEIEVWATQCEVVNHPKVKWIPFRKVKPWILQAHLFRAQVGKKIASCESWPPDNTIVHTSGYFCKRADIRFIHFSSTTFAEEAKKRRETLKLNFVRKFLLSLAVREEKGVADTFNNTQHWWVVSRKLGEKVHQEIGKGEGILSIIPNAYDSERFSPSVREKYREVMRMQYGFSNEEKVFVFSAFAHFERKGLLQAVEAVELARSKGLPFRLLILGGAGATIPSFRKKLKKAGINDDFCIYAGLVDEIEKHLSAADALLFPSHFEAFSLAEIEAGALGLRLYLTEHYGAEMILRETENGRWLPWNPEHMSEVLVDDWNKKHLGTFHTEVGEAISKERYAETLRANYQKVIDSHAL